MTPTDTATLVEQLDVLADRLVVAARGAGDHAGLRDAGSLLHSIDRLIATPKCRPNRARRRKVRDGACRFSACRRPAQVCENHLIPVARGGPTELANLALLCMTHHHAVHQGQWQATLHADATMSFTRRGITLTSLARGDRPFRPSRPPPRGRPARPTRPDGRQPPQPPPPPKTPTSPDADLPF